MPRASWVAAGALGAAAIGSEPSLAVGSRLLVVAILAIAAVTLARRHAAPALAALAVGALLVGGRLVPAALADGPEAPLPVGRGAWSAEVVSLGSPRDGRQRATIRLGTPGGPLLAATLPRYPAVAPGDRIELTGRIRPAPASDYGRYLERNGIGGTLDADRHARLAGGGGAVGLVEGIRRTADRGLALALPEPEAGLASGILVGLRERVDRPLAADFTTAGVSHVVAISGWNIALVGGMVAALLRGRGSRRTRAVVTVGAVVAYTALAGASASVVRAAVMAGVVLVARESGRRGSAGAALAWALVLLLVADPALVRDVGLQLSAAATAGLIAWGTPLTEAIGRRTGGRAPAWLAEGLGISLAAQAATLPIVLATFGRLSLVAPLANLAVVPLVPPAMAAGGIALVGGLGAIGGLPREVATLLALPAWALLTSLVGLVRLAAALPFASLELAPGAAAIAAAAAGVGVAAAASGRARRLLRRAATARRVGPGAIRIRRRGALAAVATGVLAVALAAAARPAPYPRVVVLDVGQGDAILVEGERGGRLLVDTGGDPERLLVALDARSAPWDRRLDAVLVTHPHEDHLGALPVLLGRYRIGAVLGTGRAGTGPGAAALPGALAAAGLELRGFGLGDRLRVDGVELVAIWPPPARVTDPGDDGRTVNGGSVVLLGSANGRRFLLLGDAEEDVDPSLVAAGLPRLDLLKVSHHGSRTATSAPLLAATRPAVAAISVGERNDYGHPSPVTLERLATVGARVLRTDRHGTIEVTLAPDAIVVRVERADPPVPSGRWPSPDASPRRDSSSRSSPRAGSSPTPARSRRSRAGSRSGRTRAVAGSSIGGSSRRPRSSTTRTSSRRSGPIRPSPAARTATGAPAGSGTAGSTSSRTPSRRTRSSGSVTTPGGRPSDARRRPRRGSSRTRTSGRVSGSSRSTPASPHGAAATRRGPGRTAGAAGTTRRSRGSGRGPGSWRPRSAGSPGSRPPRSGDSRGPVRRSPRRRSRGVADDRGPARLLLRGRPLLARGGGGGRRGPAR
ncbi:MAG: hypothetical protein RL338_1574 [Chloroflexota bacterium]